MPTIFDLYSNIEGFNIATMKQDYREDARLDWRTDWRTVTPPENNEPPVYVSGAQVLNFDYDLSGSVTENDELVANSFGTWDNGPVSISYEWRADGVAIGGAVGATYVVSAGDAPEGTDLTLVITATNDFGSDSIMLGPWTVAATPGSPPADTPPTYTYGALVTHYDYDYNEVVTDGDELYVERPGFWAAYPAPTFTYQWFSDGVEIPGETNDTLYLDGMVGTDITVEITATNSEGSDTYTMGPYPVVTMPAQAPIYGGFLFPSYTNTDGSFNNDQPTLTVGDVTTVVSDGTWYGYPYPTFTYQWLRGNTPIVGATNNTYTIVSDDIGQLIKLQATGTNASGSAVGVANVGTVIVAPAAAPNYLSGATLTVLGGGPAVEFATLIASKGAWEGLDQTGTTFTYEWFVNGVSQGAPQEGTFTFPIESQHLGTTITVRIVGENSSGSDFVIPTGIMPT